MSGQGTSVAVEVAWANGLAAIRSPGRYGPQLVRHALRGVRTPTGAGQRG